MNRKEKQIIIPLIFFLVWTVSPQTNFAEAENPAVVKHGRILDVSDLAIPKTLGKIDERFTGTSDRWIIHIQDIHAHFSAQENIAAIVDQLNAVYGIQTVALEGGWKSTSFPNSWGLPNSPKKQMLARALLEDAYLTGPAFAALFSQSPVTLVGIEEPGLYEINRKIYLKHLAQKEETLGQIQSLAKSIADEKAAVFNPDLRKFDGALLTFREGKKAEDFIPSVIAWAQTRAVDLSDLDQLALFKQASEIEKSIDKSRLESEAKRLKDSFKQARLSVEELLRSGKVPADKLEFYPEAKKYLDLMKVQDKIAHREFFHQIEEAARRLKSKLMKSGEEKALDARSERFFLAKNIILFQATPDDLKAYASLQAEIQSDMENAGLAEALQLGLSFYEVAKKRDDIFFEKITADPRLASGNIAVVAGGFHTDGLSERMKEAGISYVTVTPDLANEAPNEDLYFQRLQVPPPISSQTLAFYADFLEESFDTERFPQALKEFDTTNNLLKAKAIGLGSAQPMPGAPLLAGFGAARTGITFEDFLGLPRQEQFAKVQAWAKLLSQASVPKVIFSDAPVFSTHIQDSLNLSAARTFLSDNSNSLWLASTNVGDIPTEFVGARNVQSVQLPEGQLDLLGFVQTPGMARRLSEKFQNRVGIMLAPEKLKEESSRFLLFPSVRGVLLVIPPLLTGELQFSADPNVQSQFWSAIQELVAQYNTLEEILRAA